METSLLLYILTMAAVTYAIRSLPFVLVKKQITNRFLKSFLYYVPCAVLAAMVVPEIFYVGDEPAAAAAGFICAFALAWKEKGLIVVALAASAVVFAFSLMLQVVC